jgi:hypothetical protein
MYKKIFVDSRRLQITSNPDRLPSVPELLNLSMLTEELQDD